MQYCACNLCNELYIGELVLRRFTNFSVVFNKYPYLPGHIMVVSNQHLHNSLNNFTPEQRSELMEIAVWAQNILLEVVNCDSANMGVNLGPQAGGSIPEHFHFHIVPRHVNDVNFMAVTTNNIHHVYPHHQQLELNTRIYHAFHNAMA